MTNPTRQRDSSIEQASGNQEQFELSENYFERVNAEYRNSVLSGNLTENTVSEIMSRNESSFFDVISDAWQNKREAIKWVGTMIFSSIAGSWLGEMLGLSNPLRAAQERIMGIVNNPIETINDSLEGFLHLPESNFLGDIDLEHLQHSRLVTASMERLGNAGHTILGLTALKEYFETHPEETANIPTDRAQALEYYRTLLTQLGYEDQTENIFGVLEGEISIADLLTSNTSITGASETPESNNGFDWTSDEYRMRLARFAENTTPPPYQTGTSPDGLDTIEAQYFVDRGRYAADRTHNVVATFINEHRNTIGAVALATSGAGLLGYSFLRSNFTPNEASIADNIRKMINMPLYLGAMPVALIGVAATGIFLYLQEHPNAMIARDPNQFKDEIIHEIERQSWYSSISTQFEATTQKISEAISYIVNPDEIEELLSRGIEMTEEAVVSGLDAITDTPQDLVNQKNSDGFESLTNFVTSLSLEGALGNSSQVESMAELSTYLTRFKNTILENGQITAEQFEQLADTLAEYGIAVANENGMYYFSYQRENGELVIKPFMIDPTLELDEAFRVAQNLRFYHDNLGDITETPATEIRNDVMLALGELVQNFDPDRDINDQMHSLLEQGGGIGMIGDLVVMFADGGAKYLVLGPVQVVGSFFENLIGSNESGTVRIADFLGDYADNLVPITIFCGPALMINNLLRGNSIFKSMSTILTYPYHGPRSLIRGGRRIFTREGRQTIKNLLIHSNRVLFGEIPALIRSSSSIAGTYQGYHATLSELGTAHSKIYSELFEGSSLSRMNRSNNWIRIIEQNVPDHIRSEILPRITTASRGSEAWARAVLTELQREIDGLKNVTRADLNRLWLRQQIEIESHARTPNYNRLNRIMNRFRRDAIVSSSGISNIDSGNITHLKTHLDSHILNNMPALLTASSSAPTTHVQRGATSHATPAPTDPHSTNHIDATAGPHAHPTDIEIRAGRGRAIGHGIAGAATAVGVSIGAAYLGRQLSHEREEFDFDAAILERDGQQGQLPTDITNQYRTEDNFEILEFNDTPSIYGDQPSDETQERIEPTLESQRVLNNNSSLEEVRSVIQQENNRLIAAYQPVLDFLNSEEAIRNASSAERREKFRQLLEIHNRVTPEAQNFIAANYDALRRTIENSNNRAISFANFSDNAGFFRINLDPDRNQLYLQYGSESEIRRFFWNVVDGTVGNHIDRIIGHRSERTIAGNYTDTDAEMMAAYICPFTGSGLDVVDGYNMIRRGQVGKGGLTLAFGIGGLALDVLGFTTAGTTTAAATGLRAARMSARMLSIGVNVGQVSSNAAMTLIETMDPRFDSRIYLNPTTNQ